MSDFLSGIMAQQQPLADTPDNEHLLVQMNNWEQTVKESKLITSCKKYMTLTVPVFILSSCYGEYEIIFAPNSVFFPQRKGVCRAQYRLHLL